MPYLSQINFDAVRQAAHGMPEGPRLLCYRRIGDHKFDPPLWIAIVSGSAAQGGRGVVLASDGKEFRPGRWPIETSLGATIEFGGTAAQPPQNIREVWGLDAAPPEIAAAWLRLQHTGRLVCDGQHAT